MINIENLPKNIRYNDRDYSLRLHITAFNKICVCYYIILPHRDDFNEIRTILSQVVEPGMNYPINYSNYVQSVVDVPNVEYAFNVLATRLQNSLDKGIVKIVYE